MIDDVVKIINRVTGKEFTDIDIHLLSYAKSDPASFEIVRQQHVPENDKPEVFEIDDLKQMSMKSLREIYDVMAKLKGEAMPKARKNSPAETIEAILKAQEE